MIKQLNINNYKTSFILGNNDSEKLAKRIVIFNIGLRFIADVGACNNDNLDNTVCYSKLLNFLDNKLQTLQFNLVERVAQFVYDEISNYLNNEKILKRVEIIKKKPPVKNLESASFICSDW